MKSLQLSANKKPDLNALDYPMLVSGKLDGVRGCVVGDKLVSRSLKDSLNRHTTNMLSSPLFSGLDGELCLMDADLWNNFDANQSAFMTQTGEPEFVFHVFDDISIPTKHAIERKLQAEVRVSSLQLLGYPVEFCEQHLVNSADEVTELYDEYRSKGYEGIIIMHPIKPYKYGRSTLNQQISLKLKPQEDDEAVVTGYEPVLHNLDAGNSKKKENLVEGDRAGKLVADWKGKTIKFGGFDHTLGRDIMNNPDKYVGLLVKFKYMEVTKDGMPRHPIFVGFRSPDDLS